MENGDRQQRNGALDPDDVMVSLASHSSIQRNGRHVEVLGPVPELMGYCSKQVLGHPVRVSPTLDYSQHFYHYQKDQICTANYKIFFRHILNGLFCPLACSLRWMSLRPVENNPYSDR